MANINLTDSSNIEVVQSGGDISLDFTTTGDIGDLSTLTTTDNSSLVGAINEVDGLLNGLVYNETVTLASGLSVNANTNTNTATYALSPKPGYTAVKVSVDNLYNGAINLWYCHLANNQISWRVRNVSSSNATGISVIVQVLYIKNDAFLGFF